VQYYCQMLKRSGRATQRNEKLYLTISELIQKCTVFLRKLMTITQLIRIFLLLSYPNLHCRVHKRTSFYAIPSQLNPVCVCNPLLHCHLRLHLTSYPFLPHAFGFPPPRCCLSHATFCRLTVTAILSMLNVLAVPNIFPAMIS
jgi:hypothetical protein